MVAVKIGNFGRSSKECIESYLAGLGINNEMFMGAAPGSTVLVFKRVADPEKAIRLLIHCLGIKDAHEIGAPFRHRWNGTFTASANCSLTHT